MSDGDTTALHAPTGLRPRTALSDSRATAPADQRVGGVPDAFSMALGAVPQLKGATLAFLHAALGDGQLGPRVKALAVVRTATLQGCPETSPDDAGCGDDVLSADELDALLGNRPLEDGFPSASDRALIGWIDAVAGATGTIPDDPWQAARLHWGEPALLELTVAVGAVMMLSRVVTGLGLGASSRSRLSTRPE